MSAGADRAVEVEEDGRRRRGRGGGRRPASGDRTGAPLSNRANAARTVDPDELGGTDGARTARVPEAGGPARRGGRSGRPRCRAAAALFHRRSARARRSTGAAMLDLPATESGIDHVVVVMMENRSFDHWLGWLAEDHDYLEAGRSRYGRRFSIDGRQHQTFPGPTGPVGRPRTSSAPPTSRTRTRAATTPTPATAGTRAGRSATAGSSRRGAATTSSRSATTSATTCRSRRSSPAGSRRSTATTRRCSARPTRTASTSTPRSRAATRPTRSRPTGGFSVGDDLGPARRAGRAGPLLLLRPPVPRALRQPGRRPVPAPKTDYFADCAAGTLPAVSFLDPKLPRPRAVRRPPARRHPPGPGVPARRVRRVRRVTELAQRALHGHLRRVGRVLRPRRAAPVSPTTARAPSTQEDFGQAGFRVPTVIASPFARPGYVDHRTYEHTSVLRFLEWRFLGAPAEGPGRRRRHLVPHRHATATRTTSARACCPGGARTTSASTRT